MFAVIRTGGKQYRVAQNDLITVEKLAGEPGAVVEFGEVLMVGDGAEVATGAPLVAGAAVSATSSSRAAPTRSSSSRKSGGRIIGARTATASTRPCCASPRSAALPHWPPPQRKEHRMAHKKAGGSSRNGRDSRGRRLGVKKFGGEASSPATSSCASAAPSFTRASMSGSAATTRCLRPSRVRCGSTPALRGRAFISVVTPAAPPTEPAPASVEAAE